MQRSASPRHSASACRASSSADSRTDARLVRRCGVLRGVARRRAPGKGVQHVKGCRGAAQPRARRVSLACRRAPRLMPQP
eukprot:scaffold103331_cov33-Phaeocystis_antarctica.AAC.1